MCSSAFVDRSALKEHIDSGDEGKKSFQCENCKTAFTRKADFKRHCFKIPGRKKAIQMTCDGCRIVQPQGSKFNPDHLNTKFSTTDPSTINFSSPNG